MGKFSLIDTEGDFELWLQNKPYKSYACSSDKHIQNVKTGEDYGTYLVLYLNPDGTKDEDCYEIVENNKEGEFNE